nr:hypothetical protein [Tanacetum cinerariifolium]
YVAESDPEEYEDDETEDGPVDHPIDEGDDGDDDDDNSSGYDADDEDEDEEEEEEHLASADSAVVIPIDELASHLREQSPSYHHPPLTLLPLELGLLSNRRLPYPFHQRHRCTALAALPSPPLPPSLYPPPPIDSRDDIPESEQPPRKRLCLSTLCSRYEVGESSTRGRGVDYGFADTVEAETRHRGIREVGYGIKDTWIDSAEAIPEMAPMTLEKVNTRVIELAELHEHDTQDLYALLEDAQDVWIVYEEAYATREAWAHSVGLSQTQLHETHSQIQQTEMAGLQETNHVRQSHIVETLRVMRDMRQEMGDMQAELLALRGQPRRAGQPGRDVRVPNHQDAPRDADKDEHILPAEEQPLLPVISPIAESPGYVAESDLEEDLEEYEDDEIEDDLVDHPMNEGDDGDDDDGDSSRYDANDEDKDEGDEEEKGEEHLALADFAVVIPINELVSPPEGTEPIIPPPSTDTATTGARITI